MIELDVESQKIHLCVSDEEITERLRNWKPIPVPPHYQRGYAKLCIFDLLTLLLLPKTHNVL